MALVPELVVLALGACLVGGISLTASAAAPPKERASQAWLRAREESRRRGEQLYALVGAGKWRELLAETDKILAKHPEGPRLGVVWELRGKAFVRLGEYDRAMAEYARVVKVCPYEVVAVDAERELTLLKRTEGARKELAAYLEARDTGGEKCIPMCRKLVQWARNREILASSLCAVAVGDTPPKVAGTWDGYHSALVPILNAYPETLVAATWAQFLVSLRPRGKDEHLAAKRRLGDLLRQHHPHSVEYLGYLYWEIMRETRDLSRGRYDRVLKQDEKDYRDTKRGLAKIEEALPRALEASARLHIEWLRLLVHGHLRLGDVETARRWYARILKQYPQAEFTAYALLCIAEFFDARGDRQQANRLYAELFERFPNSKFSASAHFRLFPADRELPSAIDKLTVP